MIRRYRRGLRASRIGEQDAVQGATAERYQNESANWHHRSGGAGTAI
jgi:hypothetical protein